MGQETKNSPAGAGDMNLPGPSGLQGARSGMGGPPSYGLPQLDASALRQGHPLQRCLNVINYVMQHPSAAPFCSQARRPNTPAFARCRNLLIFTAELPARRGSLPC